MREVCVVMEFDLIVPMVNWSISLKWDVLTFAYSNARAKAMKSLLLPQTKIREMVSVKTVDAVTGILEETGYKQELVELSAKYSGADLVERALTKNLASTLNKLLRISPHCGYIVLHALFKKWEVHNLKTILVGKSQGHGKEKIEAFLVSAGELNESKLEELLEAKTVEETIMLLKRTDYYPVLAPLMKKFLQDKNVLPLLNALDEYYYRGVAESAKLAGDKPVSEIINAETDAKNISNILRAKANNFTREETRRIVVRGGSIPAKTIEKMIEAPDVKSTVELVKKYDLSKALEQFEATKSITAFEIDLEKQIALFAAKKMRLASVSLAALVGYLYLKETEVANIRRIVRAKEFGLPQEKIAQMVFATE